MSPLLEEFNIFFKPPSSVSATHLCASNFPSRDTLHLGFNIPGHVEPEPGLTQNRGFLSLWRRDRIAASGFFTIRKTAASWGSVGSISRLLRAQFVYKLVQFDLWRHRWRNLCVERWVSNIQFNMQLAPRYLLPQCFASACVVYELPATHYV